MRLIAAALVAVVLGDLTDAACDPIGWPGPASAAVVVAPSAGGQDDACKAFCVQDCFCCSRSETAVTETPQPTLVLVAQASAPSAASLQAVVRPVPLRPPLALS